MSLKLFQITNYISNDIEVYPNLLLIAWKKYGFELPENFFYTENGRVFIDSSYDIGSEWYKVNKNNFGIRFNPSPEVIEAMLNHPLIGFNNRKYDNHIVYNAMMGASNMELFNQSQSIIGNKGGTFGNAYNISYADLYEFLDIKMALKKWQIKLELNMMSLSFHGINHFMKMTGRVPLNTVGMTWCQLKNYLNPNTDKMHTLLVRFFAN